MFYAYHEEHLPDGLTPNLYSYPAILAFKSKKDRDSFVSFMDEFSLAFHVTKENAWSVRRTIYSGFAKKLLREHTHTYISSWPSVETAIGAYIFDH